MPEKYGPKIEEPLLLSEAIETRSLIRAHCAGCSPARWYHPQDLITLYGDMPAINLGMKMRCQNCGSFLTVRVEIPLAEERQRIRLRRLDRIWWVRRVRWRDE